jgi:predicted O-methyltransferase YrrM
LSDRVRERHRIIDDRGPTKRQTSMSKLTTAVARAPIVGPVALVAYRTKFALGYFKRPLSYLLKWLFSSRETANFTYHLEEKNKRYLASMIADIVNLRFSEIMAFFKEIEEDGELRKHIAEATERSDWAFIADKEVRLGRRIGWYAITRAIKPKVVIETGVDKGLGSCVLTAAIKRNTQEGYAGRYFGLDINPKAGYLLSAGYADYGSILHGDAIESLEKFAGVVDLYISDSDHSAEYEALEYRTIEKKLSEHAIVLGDNSHVTDKLLEFSLAADRHFAFFQEKPLEHWYPGAGIGISYKR